jgi:hypothetical protein
MRSAPTSSGRSTSTFIPVFTPGRMTSGSAPQSSFIPRRSVSVSGGTTDASTDASTIGARPSRWKRPSSTSVSSSTVCSWIVRRRHDATRRSPS